MATHPNILIVDYGSQYTQVISRTLRELGFRSAVLSQEKSEVWLQKYNPKAVILSGGDSSVTDVDAPPLPLYLLEQKVPILGICYGMQLLAHSFGGKVQSTQSHAEYGPAQVLLNDEILFKGLVGEQTVWASHRDTVSSLPLGFKMIANSTQYQYAGMADVERNIWAVQFHPEVTETTCGKTVLLNFIREICACEEDWYPKNIITEVREVLKAKTTGTKVIVGFSGGVDSTVLSAILSPVFKDNLLGICIDAGHLRENELPEVERHAKAAGINLKIICAEERFLKSLNGLVDAEEKRFVFRKIYKEIFEEEAKKWRADYIAQGTLITDLIESGKTGSALIKTHHNAELNFTTGEISPLDNLFKYEVRALAKELDLPDSVVNRQPFPGPGLFIRIFGGHITAERLQILREADKIVRQILANEKLEISQLVVGLDCSKTVGVKGDSRMYGYNIVVRAVKTTDFMTAHGIQLPDLIRRQITAQVTQIPEITRVFYDETNKPPATTEFE